MGVSGPSYRIIDGSLTTGGGNVTGAGSSTDNALVRWNGSGGSDIQNSAILVDDSNNVTGMGTLGCGAITTTGDLTFSIASAATATVTTSVEDGALLLAGGASGNRGRLILYGASNGSKPGNVELFAGANKVMDVAGATGVVTFPFSSVTVSNNIGVGGAAVSTALINLGASNPLTGADQRGITTSMTFTSAATTRIRGISLNASSAAAAHTVPVFAVYQGAITAGAGSTITRAITFQAGTNGGGGTITNSAVLADNESFTGDYFIHSTNTNPSILTGNVTVGTGGAADYIVVRAEKSISSSSTDQYGVWSDVTSSSSATSSYQGYYSRVNAPDVAFTMARGWGYFAATPVKGASATITRYAHFRGASFTGVATNSAFMADNATFTGDYFIHSTSTNPTLLTGTMTFGNSAAQTQEHTWYGRTVDLQTDNASGIPLILRLSHTQTGISSSHSALHLVTNSNASHAYVLMETNDSGNNRAFIGMNESTSDGELRFSTTTDTFASADLRFAWNSTGIGFFGTNPVAQAAAYTPTNVTTDRAYDANATTLDEVADVLGTLIADLQSYGLLQ